MAQRGHGCQDAEMSAPRKEGSSKLHHQEKTRSLSINNPATCKSISQNATKYTSMKQALSTPRKHSHHPRQTNRRPRWKHQPSSPQRKSLTKQQTHSKVPQQEEKTSPVGRSTPRSLERSQVHTSRPEEELSVSPAAGTISTNQTPVAGSHEPL